MGISKGGERLKQTSGIERSGKSKGIETKDPWVGTWASHLHVTATVSSSLRGVSNVTFAGLAMSSE